MTVDEIDTLALLLKHQLEINTLGDLKYSARSKDNAGSFLAKIAKNWVYT